MTLKDDAIFKEKLIGGLKNDIRILVNFHVSSPKSESLHFDGLLLSIACKISAKKGVYRGRVISYDTKYIRKVTFCLKNDLEAACN